ncbi:MAG: NAD(P)-dependent alcohol dehydrogenase, partial [Kiloniellales bacterium]|nr:NAD(P)-dependent alcohol dehydrogenase [Kiloniellales bacterium]
MRVIEIKENWGLDHLTLSERPCPQPGPGEVLLKMEAASLNYRDLVVVSGGYGRRAGSLPLVPVSDGAGTVSQLGEGVTGLEVGDRVCPLLFQDWLAGELDDPTSLTSLGGPLDGTLAEYMAVKASGLVKVPEHLSATEAATLPCAGLTGWAAVVGQGIRPGDLVLILGTGGVALFGLQFAKLAGAEVIITSKSDEKLKRARDLGA